MVPTARALLAAAAAASFWARWAINCQLAEMTAGAELNSPQDGEEQSNNGADSCRCIIHWLYLRDV